MRIAFNPSTVAALTTPPNNKDITFDLKGRNIFARGVKFYGTDTNTWRPVVDNLTSNSTTSSLSANQGRVLKALIDGKSDSGHNHDGRYVRYYAVTTLDCNNLAAGLTAARVSATNAAHTNSSVYLYISDIGTPFQIQIPDSNVPYIYKRYYSSGKWSGWFKLNAGYADSAGSVAWANITGKPSSYTPSAHTHAWNSLTHSSTTENQAILTNGKANGWKLYTLNISGWNNAANNAHSHSNKTVLDGITSALVSNWNTAYNFVDKITKADTDKVINKWDEIVNFLAGIDSNNKLNTLLNSKLSVYELADKTNVGTIKNNGIYYSTTDASSGTLTNSPFNTGFALINMTSYDGGDDLRRSRLAFNAFGEIKVSDDRGQSNTAETWYNVLTSKNSGISGSTIKLNGTSITVYSSGTADNRYVKKSGDTMTGALNFANGTWNLVGDDSYMGDCNINGHFGIKAANTTYPGIAFFNNASAFLGNLTAYSGNIKYGAYSLQFLDNGNTSVGASTWTNPFSAYDKNAVKDGQAICVWGQSSHLSNLATDSGDMSLWLKRVNANAATLNMVLDGEYYANGNQRLAHISEIPSSLKNPHALTISLNGTSQGPYDGSAAKSINITPGSIGAATSGHNHDGRYVYNYGGTKMDGSSRNKNALGMSTTSGISEDWWHILQAAWNDEYRWNSQIAFPTQNRNGMYYRSGLDDNTKWGAWVKLLDTGNSSISGNTITINGSSLTVSKSDHNHDYLVVNEANEKSFNSAYHNFQVLYAGGGNGITGRPDNVDAFGLIRLRAAWGWSGQMLLANGGSLYIRSSADAQMTNTLAWRTILDSSNYSSILDSRYYTESEIDTKLAKKLDRVKLTTGSWNPRSYNLAADYHYNGGDLSISETGGQIHVSVDGKFWQNEGQYRVLDTSDITSIRGGLTLYQYLSSTDNNWFPLVWGGSDHKNTNNSTGSLYKSHDKLSWQTSSQTLYATNIRTENIKNLSIGGGIYWNPYVESATDGSDAASITLVKSGVAGGTTLVLSQMNDTNDTIQFKTNTAARLYHNSYPILTTQNTYVSNNKGYINGTEITQVNNADTVDGKHASDFASAGHTHDGRYLKLSGGTLTGGIEIQGTISGSNYASSEGFYTNEHNSLILRGDATYGKSGILFTSSKGTNSINQTSDKGFIQFQSYGGTNTTGEENKLVIGVGNDSTDMVYIQTPSVTGLKHVVGTNPYTIWDSGNLTKLSQLTNDKGFVTGSVNGKTITINGTSTTWSNTWRPLGTGSGDAAAGNHTHKVKINGSEKTIAATGVTDLGTYLTSQSLRGYVHAYNNTGTGNAVTSISIEGGTITANKGTTFLTSHQSLANYYTKGQVDAKLGKYLPLAGGTMDAGAQIQRTAKGGMWYQGRSIALLRETSANGYHALWSLKTTDGSWDFGEYNSSGWNNIPVLSYVLDSNFDKSSNATTYQIKFPLASGTIALTSNIPNPTDYYWANNKITSSSKIDAQVRVSSLGAGCLTTIANTVMATNWLRATGSTGIYFQDHAGGLYMSDDTWIRTYNSKALQVDNTIRSKDFNTTYIDSNSKWTITSAAKLENSTTLVYGQSTISNGINSYLRGTTVTLQVKKGTSINHNALQLTADYIYCNNYCDMKYGAVVSGGNFTVNNNSYLAQKANTKVGIGTSSPSCLLDVSGLAEIYQLGIYGTPDAGTQLYVNGHSKLLDLYLNAYRDEYFKQPVCLEFITFKGYAINSTIWSSPKSSKTNDVVALEIPNLSVPDKYKVFVFVTSDSSPNIYASIVRTAPLLLNIVTGGVSNTGQFAIMIWAIPT